MQMLGHHSPYQALLIQANKKVTFLVQQSLILKNGISSNCFVWSYPKTSSLINSIHCSLQALGLRKVKTPVAR